MHNVWERQTSPLRVPSRLMSGVGRKRRAAIGRPRVPVLPPAFVVPSRRRPRGSLIAVFVLAGAMSACQRRPSTTAAGGSAPPPPPPSSVEAPAREGSCGQGAFGRGVSIGRGPAPAVLQSRFDQLNEDPRTSTGWIVPPVAAGPVVAPGPAEICVRSFGCAGAGIYRVDRITVSAAGAREPSLIPSASALPGVQWARLTGNTNDCQISTTAPLASGRYYLRLPSGADYYFTVDAAALPEPSPPATRVGPCVVGEFGAYLQSGDQPVRIPRVEDFPRLNRGHGFRELTPATGIVAPSGNVEICLRDAFLCAYVQRAMIGSVSDVWRTDPHGLGTVYQPRTEQVPNVVGSPVEGHAGQVCRVTVGAPLGPGQYFLGIQHPMAAALHGSSAFFFRVGGAAPTLEAPTADASAPEPLDEQQGVDMPQAPSTAAAADAAPAGSDVGSAATGSTTVPTPTTAPSGPLVAVQVTAASASSALGGRDAHPADHAFDGNPRTAWNESAPGSGAGEWLQAEWGVPRHVRRIVLATGWDYVSPRAGDLYSLNSRLRRVRMVFSDGRAEVREIADGQRSVIVATDHVSSSLRIIAEQVYPGARWQDLCISDVLVEADAAPGGSATHGPARPASTPPQGRAPPSRGTAVQSTIDPFQ